MAQTANEQAVMLEQRDGIATISLNQPARLNAMSMAIWRGIGEAVLDADSDSNVKVLVVRGAGQKAFSTGADITEFEETRATPEGSRTYSRLVHETMETLVAVRKPLIAMIHGYCIGGGCEIAVCADLRIASEDATFGIPAARVGLALAMEDIRRLVDLVGPSNAKLILFTGQRFTARQAYGMGLINEIVPAATLEEHTYQLAESIRKAAPTSVLWAKDVIAKVLRDPSLESYPDHYEQAAALSTTDDFREGVRAFLEKREPRFTGR